MTTSSGHVLVVRADSLGDVLVSGPAIRAVAARADRVTVLAGPRGAEAARLLPGVDEVLVADLPWISAQPPACTPDLVTELVGRLAAARIDEALVLTSFHQSALPTALVLRLAGIARIAGIGIDYPGSLLDVRIPDPPEGPESARMLAVAEAAGFPPPADVDLLRLPATVDHAWPVPAEPFLVVHPGADADARRYPVEHWREVVALLTASGWTVLVTGSAGERDLIATVCGGATGPGQVHGLAGRLSLAELAGVLRRAAAVVVANTGPAHLAGAVGTPVVCLFAPVVSATRWAPVGAPVVLLGDQHAACRDSRARVCPVAGHPCLAGVQPAAVVAALEQVTSARDVAVLR